MKNLIVSSVALVFFACSSVDAQWLKIPPGNVPRLPDGRPNRSAPAPRLPDGKPDLSGIWEISNIYVRDLANDLNPEDVPFQPWAKAVFDERKDGSRSREDNAAHCLPPGVPRVNAAPFPWKLIQTPDLVVILYEDFNLYRQIFLDGREREKDAAPSWFGYSTGKWEGDTLVVDTTGFNGKAWIDQLGKPSTEALHVIERFRRKDIGHMDVQITIDDPGVFTRPWTVTEPANLSTAEELMEFICNENNRDLEHLPDK